MDTTTAVVALLEWTQARLARRLHLPSATYRLQMHRGFTFRDAERLADYLDRLGVSDVYASPYLKARPGSTHGYDISDHRQFNPEIGTPEEHAAFVTAYRERGMGHLLDIVPNHMGIVGNENVWWNDVLENGQASPYAGFFDIDWNPLRPELRGKVLLPVLGEPYGKALESGQIRLRYDNGVFSVAYFDHHFPVAPCTWNTVLGHGLSGLEEQLGPESVDLMEYQSIRTAIAHLPTHQETDPERLAERLREKEVVKRRLAALTASSEPVRAFLEGNVGRFNGAADDPDRFDLLDHLLNEQPYRLSNWQVASDEINYRRFFDINELAALSMEKPEVFAATHELILRLAVRGDVTGLRIDHPDGLYDPQQYLERLQRHYALETARDLFQNEPEFQDLDWKEVEGPLRDGLRELAAGPEAPLWRPLYVVVEKILGPNETLPEDWPVHGTTGYEFLATVTNLLVERNHAPAFDRLYRRWVLPERLSPASPWGELFAEVVYRKKFLTMQVSLSSELHLLAHQLDRLAAKNRWSRDFTLNALRHALREIVACFEVYRSYITERGVTPRDRQYVERAVAQAKRRNPAISASLFDFVRDMLLLKRLEGAPEDDQVEQRRFVGKFQQLTAPVMAKGFEDTAFYVYNRLLSLNDVGGDPGQFGASVATFHRRNQDRQARSPCGLSASATHDTKRGEDLRARIDVLSEVPDRWRKALAIWGQLNRRYHVHLEDEQSAPDRNEEYFFCQTLLGAWPLGPQTPEGHAQFVERLQAYMQKAIHEAKIHTSWVNPNPAHDRAIAEFVARVLDPEANARFFEDFLPVQRFVSHYGLFNSLTATLLKVALPGVPDVYQGTELWDFSLVDPDNRRPVDYDRRRALLDELDRRSRPGSDLAALARELTAAREDGRIKLYLLLQGLRCRRAQPELFTAGDYLPAHGGGERETHVCGFARRRNGLTAVAAVPRLLTKVIGPEQVPLGREAWGDTVLHVSGGVEVGQRLRDVFTGAVRTVTERDGQPSLPLAELFADFPVALLLTEG
jgi:(1->4)-alpha-D-glucan 1-alpha-D-glucosylmutase